MNRPQYHTILAEAMNFWVANCNGAAVPDIVKSTGIIFPDTLDQITFFISEIFSSDFRANLAPGGQLAFMGCSILTYESYQYKGQFVEMRSCTPAEEELQRQYIDMVTDAIQNIGYTKKDFFELYYHQPSYAITMTVREIFEQTPRKDSSKAVNTGGNL